jgi:hypothetical protein
LLGFGLSVVIAAVLWSLLGALEEPELTSYANPGDAVQTAQPPAPAVNGTSPGNELAVLRREIAALRAEVALLRGQVLAQAVAPPEAEHPEDAGIDSGEGASGQALEQASREAEQRHAERLEAIQSALLGESVDPAWSLEATGGIEQVFTRGLFREARLLGVECRASLCRVEVLHQDPAELPQFTASFPAEVAAYANRMTMRQTLNEDGSVVTVLYLGREGYPFPA